MSVCVDTWVNLWVCVYMCVGAPVTSALVVLSSKLTESSPPAFER